VAIKTTKPHSDLRGLLKEVKVMMFVGEHSKIVGLMGCCTTNLRDGELFVVLEFCHNGSMERYLKSNKSNFVNLVQKGQIYVPKFDHGSNYECNLSPESANVEYVQAMPQELHLAMKEESNNKNSNAFDIHQLIMWSIDIAEGMEWLAMKKVSI